MRFLTFTMGTRAPLFSCNVFVWMLRACKWQFWGGGVRSDEIQISPVTYSIEKQPKFFYEYNS